MTSHLNSHRTTDIKPEMLSGVQNGKGTPHDKYNIRGIARARTNRKDDIFMQRQLVQNLTFILKWGQGTCSLTNYTLRWTYSALRYFFPACCLVCFATFFPHLLTNYLVLIYLLIISFWPNDHNCARNAMLSLFKQYYNFHAILCINANVYTLPRLVCWATPQTSNVIFHQRLF